MNASDRAGSSLRIVALFTDLLGVGGVQEAGRLTAASLLEIASSRRWPVEMLSLNDPPGERVLPYRDSEIKYWGFARGKARFMLSALGKALDAGHDGARIILAAHPHLALPASFMQRVNPAFKTIVMAHGVEVWTRLSPLRLRALQKASVVLAPSNYTARKIAGEQGIPAPKIKRLPWPLGPDFLRLSLSPSDLPLPADFPPGRIILTVGRWDATERYKGTDALIRATARLRATNPDVHLVAVGSGDDLPRLRNIAVELEAAARIHFFENLSPREVAACYAHADVFALPSTGEGFGLVFLEAMAFAKPLVGVDAGGTPDLVQDGVNGLLIPPNDTDQLARALEQLLHDEALRKKLGECGASIVRRDYRFEVFCKTLEQLLCDAASGQS